MRARIDWPAFPLVYGLHLLDERLAGDGVAAWATRHSDLALTNEAWLVVNVASFALFFISAWQVGSGRWPRWVEGVLAMHLILHGMMHVGGTLFRDDVFPGTFTSIALCLPFAALALRRAWRLLDRRVFVRAVAIGPLTMQPIYHALLAPLLSGGSP